MAKKSTEKASQKNKAEKKLTMAQALKLASKLEQKGFTISTSVQKKIVSNVAREISSN